MPISICSQFQYCGTYQLCWQLYLRCMRPGISFSAMVMALRPQSASAMSATLYWTFLGMAAAVVGAGTSFLGRDSGQREEKRCDSIFIPAPVTARYNMLAPHWMVPSKHAHLIGQKVHFQRPLPKLLLKYESMSKPTDLYNLVHFCLCHYNLTAITCHMRN